MSSKNLFDLLQDDEDVEKTVKNTKTAAAAAPVAAKKPVGEKKPENKDKSPKIVGQNKPRTPKTNNNTEVVSEEGRPSNKRDSKTHQRQPRTDASGNIRNRQFDRKSGTGRPHNENKKGGAGQGNWGKEGSLEEVAAPTTATTEETATKTEETTTATAAPAVEDKTITLAEHFKQLQAQSVQTDAPKLRVAGEGETSGQWDDFEPLVKANPVSKKDNKSTKEEKKTKKNFIQVELKPTSSRPQTRRGPKQNKQAPQVDDDKSFPALSKA